MATRKPLVQNSGHIEQLQSADTLDLNGSPAVSEAAHPGLRQLIHFIDEGPAEGFATGAYRQQLPSGDPFPTSVIWWTSAGMTAKIVQCNITRNVNETPATEVWQMYATDGVTVVLTVTDTYSYSGVVETTRTRAIV